MAAIRAPKHSRCRGSSVFESHNLEAIEAYVTMGNQFDALNVSDLAHVALWGMRTTGLVRECGTMRHHQTRRRVTSYRCP